MKHRRFSAKQIRYLWAVGYFRHAGPSVRKFAPGKNLQENIRSLTPSKVTSHRLLEVDGTLHLTDTRGYPLMDTPFKTHKTFEEEDRWFESLDILDDSIRRKGMSIHEYSSLSEMYSDYMKSQGLSFKDGIVEPSKYSPAPPPDQNTMYSLFSDYQMTTPGLGFALGEYGREGYKEINGHLRQGSGRDQVKIDKIVSSLDQGFKDLSQGLPNDIEVTRHIAGKFADELIFSHVRGELSGSLLHDKGFLSTSYRPTQIADLTPKITFHLNLPKGTKGLLTGTGENELLLQRGTQMRIRGGEFRGDILHIYADWDRVRND